MASVTPEEIQAVPERVRAQIRRNAFNDAWLLVSHLSKPKAVAAIEETIDKLDEQHDL